jgi:hypothetical protein
MKTLIIIYFRVQNPPPFRHKQILAIGEESVHIKLNFLHMGKYLYIINSMVGHQLGMLETASLVQTAEFFLFCFLNKANG